MAKKTNVKEEAVEAVKDAGESIDDAAEKTIGFFKPITDKVRDVVLGFGEIILTITVIIGLVSALISGLSTMGSVGFFSGLSTMFKEIVSVIMGALVIFLLFAIKKNGDKKK